MQYTKTSFIPKRRIHSFRDLEVYQRSSGLSSEIMSKLVPQLKEKGYPLTDQMLECSLNMSEIARIHNYSYDFRACSKTNYKLCKLWFLTFPYL